MTRRKPVQLAPPEKSEPRVTVQMEPVRDTAWAAEACREILRAQARTAARKAAPPGKGGKHDDDA